MRTAMKYAAGGAAVAALGYAAYAGRAWTRYGRPAAARTEAEEDVLLDRFMPLYDVVERHHVRVAAPPETTLAAACELDMHDSRLVRAIFKTRELVLGGKPSEVPLPPGMLATALAIGWGILAHEPGREVVLGAVTQPWLPAPEFREIPAREFAAFAEPDYVKIAWTLRADPEGDRGSIFRTETRAIATDTAARAKFRRYWALVSPGVSVIRYAMLCPIKTEAERRHGSHGSHGSRITRITDSHGSGIATAQG